MAQIRLDGITESGATGSVYVEVDANGNLQTSAVSSTGVAQTINADGSADVKTSSNSTWSYGSWPEDRHDEQGGAGTTAADIHFQTTDSTNFNEHIFEVVASTVTLEAKLNSDSAAYNDVWVEDMQVTAPQANLITGVALPVGIYKLKGNFASIKATQTLTATSSSTLTSYCK